MIIHMPKEFVNKFKDGQTFRGTAKKLLGGNLVRLNLELDRPPEESASILSFLNFWKKKKSTEVAIVNRMSTLEKKLSKMERKLSKLGDSPSTEVEKIFQTCRKSNTTDDTRRYGLYDGRSSRKKIYTCSGTPIYKN